MFRPYYGTSTVRLRYGRKYGEITVPDRSRTRFFWVETVFLGEIRKRAIEVGPSTLHVPALCCIMLKKPSLKLAPFEFGTMSPLGVTWGVPGTLPGAVATSTV